jgi:Tol biopolymer transport system component
VENTRSGSQILAVELPSQGVEVTTSATRKLAVVLVVVAVVSRFPTGSGGAPARLGSARAGALVRTLVSSRSAIVAFAQDGGRIAWIAQSKQLGPCVLRIRTVATGAAMVSPNVHVCGRYQRFYGVQLVLAGGLAAWAYQSPCRHDRLSRCSDLASFDLSTGRVRVVEFRNATGVNPDSLLAGAGHVLAYHRLTLEPDQSGRVEVQRLQGGRLRALFPVQVGSNGSDVEAVAVGGGEVATARWRVLSRGDGCGCFADPAWSHDGLRIAYLDKHPESRFAVALMNADGSDRHDITSPTAAGGSGPVWSPDGTKLAYVDDQGQIAVVNDDGSAGHELGPGSSPTWSPHGSRIAFVSGDCSYDSSNAVMVMNADGTNPQQLASFGCPLPMTYSGPVVSGLAWSPDGRSLAFSLGFTIWKAPIEVMNADGSNPHPVGNAFGDEPSWSPDSSRIVFHRCDPDQIYPTLYQCVAGLSIIGADGSGLRRLTTGPDLSPSWSPNGISIVFASGRNLPQLPGSYARPLELYEVTPNNHGLHRLTINKWADVATEVAVHNGIGRKLSTFRVHGAPYPCGVALTRSNAAVCTVDPEDRTRLTLWDPRTGARRAVVPIGRVQTFAVLGADPHWVVFQAGSSVSALNIRSHHTIRLAEVPASTLDLSVSGRRVAWLDSARKCIRAVELPS